MGFVYRDKYFEFYVSFFYLFQTIYFSSEINNVKILGEHKFKNIEKFGKDFSSVIIKKYILVLER